MNACHLRKTELEYELLNRGLSTKGTVHDLRRRLTQGLSNNVQVDAGVVSKLDPKTELEQCAVKFQDLSALVEEYEGDFGDSESQRILARLWHLYSRLGRIHIPATLDDEPENKRTELQSQTKNVILSFYMEESSQQLSKEEFTEKNRLDLGTSSANKTGTLEDDQNSKASNEEGKQPLIIHRMPPRINLNTLGTTNKCRE